MGNFLVILLFVILYFLVRYNPRLDKIIIGLDKVLILWYNKDFNGEERDYIILW